jgi:hypothetical protein
MHFWLKIQDSIREEIKENLLGTLISNEFTARKSAALGISAICSIVNKIIIRNFL